ncbi:hypothetical protein [Saccharopolyspora cebuensis]|uniref:Uncharacterized protein n=1 Tax=Saccharopolyspora cebuensis TaxID=418759 RepID=A0ABV4CF37_9PSEU
MGRTGRVLAGLVMALALVGAPATAMAEPAAVSGVAVLAQAPPPEPPPAEPAPDQQGPGQQGPGQNTAIGIAGLVLIAAVLLSRKARKKPVWFVAIKKK